MLSTKKIQTLTFGELARKYIQLAKKFENYKKESIKWSVEDVLVVAKDHSYKISHAQAKKILRETIRKHDATLGIDWETFLPGIQAACRPKAKTIHPKK